MESDSIMRWLLTSNSPVLDKLDYQIINLMVLGVENKTIAEKLKAPLSTVQRRARILIRSEYVNSYVNM